VTPFRKLIETMPKMAELVLNRCVIIHGSELAKCNRHDLEKNNLEVKCKTTWLSDDYTIMRWCQEIQENQKDWLEKYNFLKMS
jgi:hypothetical protein